MKPRCTAEEFFGKAKRNNQSIDSNRPDTCCFGVNIFSLNSVLPGLLMCLQTVSRVMCRSI